MICILLAMARNGVIGRDNDLPWHIPEDLKYFKNLTTGKSVVMGRSTFDSIGHALPNRTNYVLTRDPSFQSEAVHVLHSVDDIHSIPGTVFVIGGASVVKQVLPMADMLYLTQIHEDVEGDTFVELDLSDWTLQETIPGNENQAHPLHYDFTVYVRKG